MKNVCFFSLLSRFEQETPLVYIWGLSSEWCKPTLSLKVKRRIFKMFDKKFVF
jgi:hypothetical protein